LVVKKKVVPPSSPAAIPSAWNIGAISITVWVVEMHHGLVYCTSYDEAIIYANKHRYKVTELSVPYSSTSWLYLRK